MFSSIKEKLQSWYEEMNEREKRMFFVFTSVIVLISIVGGFYLVSSNFDSKAKKAKKIRSDLSQLYLLENRYRLSKIEKERDLKKLEKNNVPLFSLLQKIADNLDLQLNDLQEKKIPKLESSYIETSVVVNLKKLSLDKMNSFLTQVENNKSGIVKITRLRVKTRFDNPELLDVQMAVTTWNKA